MDVTQPQEQPDLTSCSGGELSVAGASDLRGGGHTFLKGRVAVSEPQPEGPLPGRDAGQFWELGRTGPDLVSRLEQWDEPWVEEQERPEFQEARRGPHCPTSQLSGELHTQRPSVFLSQQDNSLRSEIKQMCENETRWEDTGLCGAPGWRGSWVPGWRGAYGLEGARKSLCQKRHGNQPLATHEEVHEPERAKAGAGFGKSFLLDLDGVQRRGGAALQRGACGACGLCCRRQPGLHACGSVGDAIWVCTVLSFQTQPFAPKITAESVHPVRSSSWSFWYSGSDYLSDPVMSVGTRELLGREVPGWFPPDVWSCEGLQMAFVCRSEWPVLDVWAVSAQNSTSKDLSFVLREPGGQTSLGWRMVVVEQCKGTIGPAPQLSLSPCPQSPAGVL
ncbi:hypothetical protein HPG69_014464 [Diceros bicornis minor]|uniref:Uncharacterized protein n=1 Tax=Diceros bicornis minor TaxID=77932 RepID=A0A7J7F9S4_DICBM|nr:hypothetical protein HPG69_014464 [Diceros bicornis minor]